MDNYSLDDWLAYIAKNHPSEIDLGLDRVFSVFSAMGICRPTAKVVVVAGTNGKGSTCAMIEAGLMALGFRVGVYSSPHISQYNERVRIDGRAVSDQLLCRAFANIERTRDDTTLSYFEFGTLAAIDILFSDQLDIILLEVGLGGRLDAVNIIDADLTIITSIGIDHTDWLGDTVDKIGLEKAGILRQNTPFLAGDNLPSTVYKRAKALRCPTRIYGDDFGLSVDNKPFVLNDREHIELEYLPEILIPSNNILLSLQAVRELNELASKKLRAEDWEKVLSSIDRVSLPGRLECVKNHSEVYLDVGHNPHSAAFLAEFLSSTVKQGASVNVVYSSLQDKDVDSVVTTLSPFVSEWFIAPLNVERSLSSVLLKEKVGRNVESVVSFPCVSDAITEALLRSELSVNSKVITLIFGSFYIVDAAKKYFEKL